MRVSEVHSVVSNHASAWSRLGSEAMRVSGDEVMRLSGDEADRLRGDEAMRIMMYSSRFIVRIG